MSSETTTHLEGDELVIVTSWPDQPWPDSVERLEADGPFHTIEVMQRVNDQTGHHFFSRDAMRFFRSRVAPGVSHGRIFITSEQFDYTSPRLYTVRALRDDGTTTSLTEFQAMPSLRAARAFVRDLYKVKVA